MLLLSLEIAQRLFSSWWPLAVVYACCLPLQFWCASFAYRKWLVNLAMSRLEVVCAELYNDLGKAWFSCWQCAMLVVATVSSIRAGRCLRLDCKYIFKTYFWVHEKGKFRSKRKLTQFLSIMLGVCWSIMLNQLHKMVFRTITVAVIVYSLSINRKSSSF